MDEAYRESAALDLGLFFFPRLQPVRLSELRRVAFACLFVPNPRFVLHFR